MLADPEPVCSSYQIEGLGQFLKGGQLLPDLD